MKSHLFAKPRVMACVLMLGIITARSTVTPGDVVSIDIAATTGSILEATGTLDLALNLGDSASAPINGGS